ncbi:MAG: hypothetical protein IJU65_09170 [Desulfovibrio sp.]|nr:hypothetical protein [Desulfovibrio sp.]
MAEEHTAPVMETAEQGLHDAATGTSLQTTPAVAGNDSTPPAPATDNAGKDVAQNTAASKQAVNSAATEKQESKADASNAAGKEKGDDQADKPITDWSKVTIDIPEGAAIDPALMDDFGKAAVAMGLTAKQANALVNFQLEAIARSREGLMNAGARELAREWGSRASANQKAVLTLITNIDRQLGNDSFSKALNDCGATCLPAVVKGLLAVANLVSEESLGRGGAAAQPEHEETALEGLQNAFKAARTRQ